MKRIRQLHPLSMEHHLSLSLAAKAIRTAQSGDSDSIQALCLDIIDQYERIWRQHFDHEEAFIFEPFGHLSSQLTRLCEQLTQEHRRFDRYIEQMKAGECEGLLEFGELLRAHTRLEERELFPLISDLLSEQQLDNIYQRLTGA